MTLAVVSMFREQPSLMDIPNQLRQLANAIESGEQPAEAALMLVVEPGVFKPAFYGWGKIPDRHVVAGLFNHAAQLALTDHE